MARRKKVKTTEIGERKSEQQTTDIFAYPSRVFVQVKGGRREKGCGGNMRGVGLL
jgi:hypothetical protein